MSYASLLHGKRRQLKIGCLLWKGDISNTVQTQTHTHTHTRTDTDTHTVQTQTHTHTLYRHVTHARTHTEDTTTETGRDEGGSAS